MADMRITDTLAMTKSLDQFRHLDQQERALSERIAAQVAEKELVEHKKIDVEEMDHAVADRSDGGPGGEYHGSHSEREKKEEEQPAPPEVSEGHLLDLKA